MPDNIKICVQTEDFDVSEELTRLRSGSGEVGAVVNFVGVVRDVNLDDSVATLELEHYPGMTEKSIEAIVDEAFQRWSLISATVIHRVGRLAPGDQIVLVAVSSRHRGEAFSACEFIMDYLKTRAPFWKKELTDQSERWVDSRSSDLESAQRWEK